MGKLRKIKNYKIIQKNTLQNKLQNNKFKISVLSWTKELGLADNCYTKNYINSSCQSCNTNISLQNLW